MVALSQFHLSNVYTLSDHFRERPVEGAMACRTKGRCARDAGGIPENDLSATRGAGLAPEQRRHLAARPSEFASVGQDFDACREL
jgi:hypothetical protein